MVVIVNDEKTELENGATVAVLAKQMNLPANGVAIAVNNNIVSRVKWGECGLQDGDKIVIINAVCGG